MPLYRHLSFTLDNRVCGHNRPPWVCRCNFSFDAVKGIFTPPRLYFFAERSEYNRGSSYHRAFYAPMSFFSFLPLSMFAPTKNRAMPLCYHITTLPCRPIRHTLARYLDTDTPCGCFATSKSGLYYWYDCTIPTLRTNTQTTT